MASVSNHRILAAGDCALAIEFGDVVSRALSGNALSLDSVLRSAQIPGVVETVPTFRSLLVSFDPQLTTMDQLAWTIEALIGKTNSAERSSRVWRLPVCYDSLHAIDLEEIARYTKLSTSEVVRLHASSRQHVYMLGFLPGQPYLGDLDTLLDMPRRRQPRMKVEAGAVGITGRMTCIFPRATPCGLNVVGRSPIDLWQRNATPNFLLSPGDQVEFEPITAREFDLLSDLRLRTPDVFTRYQQSLELAA